MRDGKIALGALNVTAKPRGTGLGLTVVQRVAEAHGGRVSVGGEAGRGASFRQKL
ncbi:MAG: hypothetical protein EOO38_16330 [Cytophagaceae bacterium]|nr:MAG: hypothetical protein EOO38_16330 [Cytophagaceae bacterium]